MFTFWMQMDLIPVSQLWILPVSRFPVYWSVGGAWEWVMWGNRFNSFTSAWLSILCSDGDWFFHRVQEALLPSHSRHRQKEIFSPKTRAFFRTHVSPKFRQNESVRIFRWIADKCTWNVTSHCGNGGAVIMKCCPRIFQWQPAWGKLERQICSDVYACGMQTDISVVILVDSVFRCVWNLR